MATNALRLQVLLSAVDKVTKPIKAITEGSGQLAAAVKATRDQLKEMKQQQRDVAAYRTANIEIAKQARAMRDLQTKVRSHTEGLDKQRAAHVNLKGNLKAAQTQYNKLSKALIDGKGDSAQFRLELEKAQIRLQSSQQAFTRSASTIKQYTDRIRGAETRLDQLKRQQQASQTTLSTLKTKLDQAGIGTEGLGKKAREQRRELEKLNTTYDQQKEKLKQLEDQQKRLQKIKDTGSAMHGAGMSVAAHGVGAAYGAANLAGRAGRMLSVGMEFDATMSKVQALARLDKDSEQMQALRAQAKKLGAETMFSASDAASGQAFLAMAGFTPDAIQAAMPGLLDMALAGDMELGRTADIASNILGGFKLDASQMGNVADILTKAFTTSNVSLEMLGDTMKYVGPVAAAAGMSLEESAAMAGLLGNVGIQSSEAGTTLRSMMLRIAAPAGQAAKAMEKLGVKSRDSEGNVRNMIEVLGDVAKATEGMGSGEQLEYLKQIFGEEPAAGMAELLSKAGDEGIEKYLDIIRDHQGAAGTTARAMADNLKGDLDQLSSAWEGIQVEFFDQNSGALRELVQQVTQVLDRINVWIQDNPELVASLAKWAAITLAVVGGLGTLGVIIGTTMMGIGGLLKAFVALGPALGILKAIAGGVMLLGKAVLFNPIGIAIAAIATAGYLLWRNWDGVVGGLKALWADLASVAQAIWGGLANFFGGLWQQIKTAFGGGIGGINSLLINWSPLELFYKAFAGVMGYLGVDLPNKFSEFGGMMMQGLVKGIKNAAGAVKNAVVGAADSSIGWFKDKLGIHSPSRVFASLGGDTMAGLEQGLAGGESGALKQLAGTAKRLTSAGALAFGITAAPLALASPAQPAAAHLDAIQQPIERPAEPLETPALSPLTQPVRWLRERMPSPEQPSALQQAIDVRRTQIPPAPHLDAIQQPARLLFEPLEPLHINARLHFVGLEQLAGMEIADMPQIDSRPPLAAASSSAAGGITIAGDTITIIVQAGQGQDVAQQIKRALEEHERNKLTRARSALYDQD